MTEVFETKVTRIGNSFGVIIPHKILGKIGSKNGDAVKIAILTTTIEKRNALLKKIAGTAKGARRFEREREDRY
jgi:antitoxin component of MazEF toxin-antitoxin module